MQGYLIEVVLTIILLIASKYVLPWLKDKKIYNIAKIAVEAAEQVIKENGQGALKFEQAKEWLLCKTNISEEEARKYIEAAVYNMNKINTNK